MHRMHAKYSPPEADDFAVWVEAAEKQLLIHLVMRPDIYHQNRIIHELKKDPQIRLD